MFDRMLRKLEGWAVRLGARDEPEKVVAEDDFDAYRDVEPVEPDDEWSLEDWDKPDSD